MTHPDPKAALEEILERHKGQPATGFPEGLCPACGWISAPCDAARVAKAMLGVVEAADIESLRQYHELSFLDQPSYHAELESGESLERCEQCVSRFLDLAGEALARAAQDLEPK